MTKRRRWTQEQKDIFNLHAGKLPDAELAALVGLSARDVKKRRGYNKIRLETTKKIPKAFKEYVKQHYRTMTNLELEDKFIIDYPAIKPPPSIKCLLERLDLHRTPKEVKQLWKKMAQAGRFRKEHRKTKPGTVANRFFRNKRRWVIKKEDGKWYPYERWVWEQHHGAIPTNKRIIVIDPNEPITIDNIEMVHKSAITQDIGDIVYMTTKKGKPPRPYVKVAQRKYKILEVYIWEQAHGPITHAQTVRRINPDLPIALENLEVHTRAHTLDYKLLTDDFIKDTLTRKDKAGIKDVIEQDHGLIELQRMKLTLMRLLKDFKNGGK